MTEEEKPMEDWTDMPFEEKLKRWGKEGRIEKQMADNTIYACFEAIRGEPDFDALALLTYDEELAKEWVKQYPYTTHEIKQCVSCGRWGTLEDDEEKREMSEGRWYTPWRIDVVSAPLKGGDNQPGKYSVNNNQTYLHIMSQDKILGKK